MALTNELIQQTLSEKFGSKVSEFNVIHDMLAFEADSDALLELVGFLKNDSVMRFNFLTDICGMHFPDADPSRHFAVVYHMHNWRDNIRIRFKCFLHADAPEIESLTPLFVGANWQERETYDFYGIIFKGHPQLKRILNMDEMISFPMRKEFPLEDGGRTDKDDRFFGRTQDNYTQR